MSAQNYKVVMDILIKAGKLNKYGDPVDKSYGQFTDASEDGNLWLVVADYIKELEGKK